MTAKRHTMFDELPPKLQAQWRANSAKGGRGARGAVKARAARIGWQKSPDRRVGRRPGRPAGPMPSGFFCGNPACGKWHEFPARMNHTQRMVHDCACGARHSIFRGVAKMLKRKAVKA